MSQEEMQEKARELYEDWHEGVSEKDYYAWACKAAGVLAALAQPVQPASEPVAWMSRTHIGDEWDSYDFSVNEFGSFRIPLYAFPQVAQPAVDMQDLQDAYRAGWQAAAAWVPDCALIHLVGSAPYLKDMAKALSAIKETT